MTHNDPVPPSYWVLHIDLDQFLAAVEFLSWGEQVSLAQYVEAQYARERIFRAYADLFATVLDGRNASLSGDVERILGRPPRDFAEYVASAVSTGVWDVATGRTA